MFRLPGWPKGLSCPLSWTQPKAAGPDEPFGETLTTVGVVAALTVTFCTVDVLAAKPPPPL